MNQINVQLIHHEKSLESTPSASTYEYSHDSIIKVFNFDQSIDQNSFLAKFSTWKQLNQSCIVPIKSCEVFQMKNNKDLVCGIVMDKMPYSIKQLIEERALGNEDQKSKFFTIDEFFYLSQQILSCCCFLESKGLVHNNLKISNLFVDNKGKMRVSDLQDTTLVENSDSRMANDCKGVGDILFSLATLKSSLTMERDQYNQEIITRYGDDMLIYISSFFNNPTQSLKDSLKSLKKLTKDLKVGENQQKVSLLNLRKKKDDPKDQGGDQEEKKSSDKDGEPKISKKKEKKLIQRRPSIDENFTFDEHYQDTKDKFGDGKFPESKQGEIKIIQWNLNNIAASLRPKEGVDPNPVKHFVENSLPDIFCVTETHLRYMRINDEPVGSFLSNFGYTKFFNCFKGTKSRHGTAIYTKIKPISVIYDLGKQIHDQEGRTITMEFDKFYLINSYVPNAGRQLQRLEYRTTEWDVDFREFCLNLAKKKNLIICGDLNVAHKAIDIHQEKRYAGYTIEERQQFSKLLDAGFVDTFRHLNPTSVRYTYFSPYFDSRTINKGWRLDYFLINQSSIGAVKSSEMYEKVEGSDHVPTELILDLSKLS